MLYILFRWSKFHRRGFIILLGSFYLKNNSINKRNVTVGKGVYSYIRTFACMYISGDNRGLREEKTKERVCLIVYRRAVFGARQF